MTRCHDAMLVPRSTPTVAACSSSIPACPAPSDPSPGSSIAQGTRTTGYRSTGHDRLCHISTAHDRLCQYRTSLGGQVPAYPACPACPGRGREGGRKGEGGREGGRGDEVLTEGQQRSLCQYWTSQSSIRYTDTGHSIAAYARQYRTASSSIRYACTVPACPAASRRVHRRPAEQHTLSQYRP
eukprot:3933411-Rhodomonas_salina.2